MKSKYLANIFLLLLALLFVISDSRTSTWPPNPEFLPQLPPGSPEFLSQDSDDFRELRSFWKIFVPDQLGKIMASHIEIMREQEYFQNFSSKDFDHGHFILSKGADLFYYSPESFLEKVVMILYHTQEATHLWRKQAERGVPTEQRILRSILGFLNGLIRPAAQFAKMEFSHFFTYDLAGTVDSYNVRDTLELFNREGDVYIAINQMWCKPEGYFAIKPLPLGRYSAGGKRYDIFLRYIPYSLKSNKNIQH